MDVKGPAHRDPANAKSKVKHCHFNNPITLAQTTTTFPSMVRNGWGSVMGKSGMLALQNCPSTGTVASTFDQKPFPPKVNAVKISFNLLS